MTTVNHVLDGRQERIEAGTRMLIVATIEGVGQVERFKADRHFLDHFTHGFLFIAFVNGHLVFDFWAKPDVLDNPAYYERCQ